jgi:stringent starvation protein B
MYQWIVDNGMTPHLLVDTSGGDCLVPIEHVQDSKIVLNIAPMAISGLTLGDDVITFSARFSGKSQSILAPVQTVLAIYAKENGQGMMFSEDENASETGNDDGDPDPDKPKPTLRVVK